MFAQIITCFILLLGSMVKSEETELALLQIMFRHGDRTPVSVYPNDPNKVSVWSKFGGLGQLTQTGIKQHYEYGIYLRERYSDFLNQTYNRNQVVVKSTTYDRTMMSVESLIASLYKPVDYQVWNDNLLWQPIPVITANLDALWITKCPRYDQLANQVVHSEEFINATNHYMDVIDAANNYSGIKNNSLITLGSIADTTFVEKNYNLTVPKWVDEYYSKLLQIQDIGWYFLYRTLEMAKLTSGGVLNEMSKNIANKINGTGSTLQLALFSAHDTYISSFTKLLGLSDEMKQPPYVSSVILELRRSKNGLNYYVQVYLKNNTANQSINPHLVTISGCDTLCPLADFTRIISDKIVDNPTVACAPQVGVKHQEMSFISRLTFVFSIGVVAMSVILVSAFALVNYWKIFNRRSAYMRQEL